MKSIIGFCEFSDRFRDMGREDQFTYAGKKALFDWLEEYEEDTGATVDLDVIALCCEFTEYADIEEFQSEYGEEYEKMEDIEEATLVIPVGHDSFIIQAF